MSPAKDDLALDLEGTTSAAVGAPSDMDVRRAGPEDAGVTSIMAIIRDSAAALDFESAYLGKALGTT